jgi:hypothetical protein
MEKKTDNDYFEARELGTYYISKSFSLFNSTHEKRFINKVFEHEGIVKLDQVKVKGELVLRTSPSDRDQVKVLVLQDSNQITQITLQKFVSNNPKPLEFSFRGEEFGKFLDFLRTTKQLDLSNKNNHRVNDSEIDASKVLISSEDKELLNAFKSVKGQDRINLFEKLRSQDLTKEDLDILTGRKKGLEQFRQNLFEESNLDEKDWQRFFNENTWIFGYGLDYKFLELIQREASVSNVDLDGKNTVNADFLLGTNQFTVLVELKRPDTALFEGGKNRSESWKLSKDLTYAISQILTQKAEWEIKSTTSQYDEEGNPIIQKTIDPKTILIIGSSSQFKGDKKEDLIKAKTFELYRRNSRNIEILTYSELYEKAFYIVNQKTL